MNIRKTIITATVALTMVAMIAPMAANASTASDLQAQINALMAQLSALNSTTTTTTSSGSMPAACVGVSFTRNLRVGMSGQDVKCLQVILNMSASTQVATTGAGSPGSESMYFGPLTLHAVMIWQGQQGWTPASQVGPLSRAKLNAWLAGTSSTSTSTTTTTTTTTGGLPAGCTSAAGYSPVTGQSCATGQTTQTGPVTAMLASDTPAAGSIVGGQATADLLHVTFNGSGTVTSVTLTRSGISDQNTLTNVYLFDGNTRITDGYSFNVNGQIVINGLSINVAGSHTISARADVASAAAVTASTIAVSLTGYTANATTSTASIMGNTMAIVVGNLATAGLSANTTPSTANVNAGTTGYTFWSAPLQINTRAVWLKGANFKMIGSAPSDALSNIKLFIDGVDTGKVGVVMAINGSNYASFDLTSAPISLMTGSHTIDLRADIQKGTNRTVQVSLQQASDLTIFDPQVGVNIAVGGPGNNSSSAVAFSSNSGTTVTILTGSVTVVVDPSFTTMTNISGGAANATIAKFKLHAYGEDVKIQTINVIPSILGATSTGATCTTDSTTGARGTATGTCGLNNVTLYFNGSQVGSQVNYSDANGYTMGKADVATLGTAIAFTLGSQVIVPAGQDSYLEVRTDLQTTANVSYTGGTIKVGLPVLTTNGQGMSSQATLGVPAGAVSTTGLTIQTGNLAVSANSSVLSQTISPNTAGVKIGSYTIQNQSTSEAIRLTQLTVTLDNGAGAVNSVPLTELTTPVLSNFSALRTSDTTGSGSTPIQPTASNTFSINDTLAIGASMTVDIFAQTGSATSGNVRTSLNVSSIGAVDNISTTSGVKTGQTMALGAGAVVNPPTLVVSSTTPAQYVAAGNGGATSGSQATFNFVSTTGATTITELKFTVTGSDANPSQTVTNVCIGTICAQPVAGVADLTGLALAVPNGGSGLTQTAIVSYSSVGTGGITPSSTSITSLTYIKYQSGGATGCFGTPSGCTALTAIATATPTITLVGSKPTVVVAAGGATGMIMNTSTKVGQVTLTADAKGAIKLRQLNFVLGYSGFTSNSGAGPSSISSAFLALGGQSTAISGVTCTAVSITNVVCKTTTNGGTFTYGADFTIAAGQSQQFDLYMTTTGEANTGTNKASVSSQLYNTSGGDETSTAAATSAFLWDDTSNNGTNGTGLTGNLIYGFPTGAYSVSQ